MQPPANHVAMMQIDCEVMNTRLLFIKDDAIPYHMSASMKDSNASLQRNESKSSSQSHHHHRHHQPQPSSAFANSSDSLDQASKFKGRVNFGAGSAMYDHSSETNLISSRSKARPGKANKRIPSRARVPKSGNAEQQPHLV